MSFIPLVLGHLQKSKYTSSSVLREFTLYLANNLAWLIFVLVYTIITGGQGKFKALTFIPMQALRQLKTHTNCLGD